MKKADMNKDWQKRDGIIGVTEYSGGIARFEKLSLYQLEELIDLGFASLENRHNYAPAIGSILEFMRSYPDFVAHGYAVSIDRDDYRVSLEGVKLSRKPTTKEFKAFINTFKGADECTGVFSSKGLWCWYD